MSQKVLTHPSWSRCRSHPATRLAESSLDASPPEEPFPEEPSSEEQPPCLDAADLFRSYHSKVHRFFENRKFSHADSDDMVQEVFLRAVRRAPSLRSAEKTRSWLFAIAANLRRDERRRQARTPQHISLTDFARDDDGEPCEAVWEPRDRRPNPETSLRLKQRRRERRNRLVRAIISLPDRMRDCVALKIFFALSNQRIATVLGISEGAVNSQVTRARKRLTKALATG